MPEYGNGEIDCTMINVCSAYSTFLMGRPELSHNSKMVVFQVQNYDLKLVKRDI